MYELSSLYDPNIRGKLSYYIIYLNLLILYFHNILNINNAIFREIGTTDINS
jgi:hypothetical protein